MPSYLSVAVVVIAVVVVVESGDLVSGDGARAPPSSFMSTGALCLTIRLEELLSVLHGLQPSDVV